MRRTDAFIYHHYLSMDTIVIFKNGATLPSTMRRPNTIDDVIMRREEKLVTTQQLLEELGDLPKDSFQRIDSAIIGMMDVLGYTSIFDPHDKSKLRAFSVSEGACLSE